MKLTFVSCACVNEFRMSRITVKNVVRFFMVIGFFIFQMQSHHIILVLVYSKLFLSGCRLNYKCISELISAIKLSEFHYSKGITIINTAHIEDVINDLNFQEKHIKNAEWISKMRNFIIYPAPLINQLSRIKGESN